MQWKSNFQSGSRVLRIKCYEPIVIYGIRVGICQCRQCRQQCKIFASGVNFSIFTHFFVFLSRKLLKLAEIDGIKVLA